MAKPNEKRSVKNSRWGRIAQVLQSRKVQDGTLRLYECLDLPKRQGDNPYQVEMRVGGKTHYLVAHPEHYDIGNLEQWFLSLDSPTEFWRASKELNKQYTPDEISEERSEDHRNLGVERIVEGMMLREPFDTGEYVAISDEGGGEDPFGDAAEMFRMDD